MKYLLEDLIEAGEFDDIFDEFFISTGLPLGLIDNKGDMIIQSGTIKGEGHTYAEWLKDITVNINEGYRLYGCSDGSSYAVFPISMDSKSAGYLISGPLNLTNCQISESSNLLLTLKTLCHLIYEKLKSKKARVAQEAAEKQLEICTLLDPVTYLPNRMQFFQRLDIEVGCCKAGDAKLAIFSLDLDNFKDINDAFGYEYGDIVLRKSAEQLRKIIGKRGLVCRFGGDQFAAFISDVKDEEEALHIGESIASLFRGIIRVDDYEMLCRASVGIALYPNHGKEYKALIKNADTAMQNAKSSGKSQCKLYESTMAIEIKSRTLLEVELKKAVDEKQFLLHYQPVLDYKSGRITKAEALIRWDHPQCGLILPSEFINIAEEDGLIISMGEWVLKTACEQCKTWHDNGCPLSVSVNISAIQLKNNFFAESVRNILNTTGLDPKYLELEVTESELIKRIDENIDKLKELRNMGVRIALDDFGTGYSSLSYLYMLPISDLKIDKSFIDEVCSDRRIEAIIDGIILLSKGLDLDVTAEGVEKEEQFKLLANKGCDCIQGYYISRPLEAGRLEEFCTSSGAANDFSIVL
ncbi:putative bifunctional diguanylate cyclase/phosphodiesterase [Lutispora sp.]|uniref:putative bifunctional diguanylate cyclase/phosphodiesterase n=1 Tax=Lutispora sp. TaxID=2828727 RepID=UPI000EF02EC6|nr:bifunctional diguanylate cyclase/phosphodiesterase [Lutispora sp.]MEA4961253.1 bifunctional diguanylate cyclase/phosphodiesterase [Lutispora sp.]HCJ57477.1 hypothetical protein [Clostridiaceae bacterium]